MSDKGCKVIDIGSRRPRRQPSHAPRLEDVVARLHEAAPGRPIVVVMPEADGDGPTAPARQVQLA